MAIPVSYSTVLSGMSCTLGLIVLHSDFIYRHVNCIKFPHVVNATTTKTNAMANLHNWSLILTSLKSVNIKSNSSESSEVTPV